MGTSTDSGLAAGRSGDSSVIEARSIEVVPDGERHGTPRSQFTLWFGATTQITAVVDGALAVVFGADPVWGVIGLLIGNLLGGAVMALHSAQGPLLGLPQMISSRAQFGVFGAAIPLVLVIVMYLGFAATGTVLSGQAINQIIGVDVPWIGIVVFGLLTLLIALLGYKVIHRLGRVATVLGVLGFGFLTVQVLRAVDVGALIAGMEFAWPPFLLSVALGAGWQLTFGPYVADYSRYLPRSTPPSRTFRYTLLGSVLGSQWSMTLGALVATLPARDGGTFLADQVGFLGAITGPGLAALAIYLVIVSGKLTVNSLNAYGGFMCALTTVAGFTGTMAISRRARGLYITGFIAVSVIIALAASADFLENFKNFVLVLLMVFTPWSAINLIDCYLISKERIDTAALYDADGRYGRWNVRALLCYGVGIVVQIPFLAQKLYTGPITELLGGADISWMVGLVLTGALYLVLARRDPHLRGVAR
ncbi:MAG TPA: cytosine permease [Microlunatus sp.]|nr:cytosine permease [Microlunatus sp.]